MSTFRQALAVQRYDDHRYYHHSRVNQSLHLVSAISFLTAYALLISSPVLAALVGWLVAMTTRQIGHFFFEPKGFDEANQATHDHKEAIKVGYNLKRKTVLLAIWALTPVALYVYPTLGGLLLSPADTTQFVENVARVWLVIGLGAIVFRTVQLCLVQNVQTGLVWATKIADGPIPRHQALSQVAAVPAARAVSRRVEARKSHAPIAIATHRRANASRRSSASPSMRRRIARSLVAGASTTSRRRASRARLRRSDPRPRRNPFPSS